MMKKKDPKLEKWLSERMAEYALNGLMARLKDVNPFPCTAPGDSIESPGAPCGLAPANPGRNRSICHSKTSSKK